MSAVIDIKGGKEFEAKVLKSKVPVLVDFWAPWCMPCRMMAPVLDDIAGEKKGKLVIAKVNTEEPENQDLAMLYQIRSIPNMKLFNKGKITKDFLGFRPKEVLSEELEVASKE